MGDKILISDLLLRTIIGVNADERRNLQDVVVNIEMEADTHAAAASDSIEEAINYRSVSKRVIELVEGSRYHLVEKLAAEIAAICLEDERVSSVRVRVEKPGALRFARSVGVEIVRSRVGLARGGRQVLLSLGANLDPERHLCAAVERLAQRFRVLAVSPVYESAPVGGGEQPAYLNAAVLLETEESIERLRTSLQAIESELGRPAKGAVRSADKFAPRTIDLDIAFYGNASMELEDGRIPHPDVLRYAHVACPLADVAPHWRHPETGQTLLEIAQGLPCSELTRRPDVRLIIADRKDS